MKENGSIEIISFNQVDNVEEQQVFDGLRVLNVFYKKFDGYHGMHVAKGEEGQWTLDMRSLIPLGKFLKN